MLKTKYIISTLLISFITLISTAQSDELQNGWILEKTEIGKMKIDGDDWVTFKQETRTTAQWNVILDPNDKYQLNQDLIVKPIRVTKYIQSDIDMDDQFDAKVMLTYLKMDTNLLFQMDRGGLKVSTEDSDIRIQSIVPSENPKHRILDGRITDNGTYTIYLSNEDQTTIEVQDYSKF